MGIVRLLVFGLIIGWVFLKLRAILTEKKLPEQSSSEGPHAILGVSSGASQTEIKEAFHRELAKYHPDKVSHLGSELQTLAQKKTTAIIAAYQKLNRDD